MTDQLTFKLTTVEGFRVVQISGEIDISNGPMLQSTIEGELANGTKELIIDLSGVPFMDSSGLSVLMGVAKQLGPESFGVAGSQPPLVRIFTLTGSDKMIPLFASVSDAIESMRSGVRPGLIDATPELPGLAPAD